MNEKINEMINDANLLIKNKKFEEAKKILNDYIDKTKDSFNDDQGKKYTFANLTEFYLFVNIYKPKKDITWVNLRTDVAYKLLGYIAIEEKNYKGAIKYLNKSFTYNPINLDSFFELVEAYKMLNDLDKMKETIDNLYDYIYDENLLATYYRKLGFYYIEKEKYELAFALYLISVKYKFNQFALSEMMYIRQKLNDPSYMIEVKDAIRIIEKENIKIGISNRNLDIIKKLSRDSNLKKQNSDYIKMLKNSISILTNKIK